MVLGGIGGEVINSAVVIVAVSYWLNRPLLGLLADFVDFKGSLGQLRAKSLQAWGRLRPQT